MARRGGFSFVELVVTAVLATLLMSGFAELLTGQIRQLGWVEGRAAAGGRHASAAVVVDDQELLAPGIPLSTVAVVDVGGIVQPDDDTLVATVLRRTAIEADCGRGP